MNKTGSAAVQTETVFHTVRGAVHRVRWIRPPEVREGLAPIVFLHEGLGCIEVWKDVPAAVCAASRRMGLVYDRRGYGESADYPTPVWRKDYLIAEAGYLPPLLDALRVDRAVLMGHSDGASLALLAAALAPDRVGGVISEAAHIFVEEITLAGIREAVAAYESGDLREKLSRFLGPRTDSVFRRWADTWLSPEFRDWNIEAFLPQIACPLLVLQGAGDPYGTPAQVEGIARGVSGPVETALLPDCGHIPHFQAREAVLSRTLAFMEALDQPSGSESSTSASRG
jgi:pimeloyl-ACP methyl ester carboxylesterase